MVAYVCNPSIWEAEFKVSWGDRVRLCLKTKQNKTEQKRNISSVDKQDEHSLTVEGGWAQGW
jgi:hypothetical protein